MPTCDICRFQVVDTSTEVCPNCGAALRHSVDEDESSRSPSRGVEESGGGRTNTVSTTPSSREDDTLEICDPGEFLAGSDEDVPPAADTQSADDPPTSASMGHESDDTSVGESGEKKEAGITKLSDEQINSIRSNMLGGDSKSDSDYVTADDASSILHSLSTSHDGPDLQRNDSVSNPSSENDPADTAGDPTSREPDYGDDVGPQADIPKRIKTAPNRNIAYFHKKFIQLTGNIHPTNGEELVIEDRHYVLRPKRIKPQYTIGAFVVLVAILLFIVGKQFISPTVPGNGTVIGIILDESGRPLAKGITLTLPETGSTAESDPLGFFRFTDIPTGTYVVRYSLPDGRSGEEPLSVVSEGVTIVSLSTTNATIDKVAAVDPGKSTDIKRTARQESRQSSGTTAGRQSETTNEKPPVKTAAEPQTQYSALTLNADVDGARLIVNGETLGRGNVTYHKLGPGAHSARVTKDGYQPWSGTVTLRPGETYTLSVSLDKTVVEEAEPEYTAEDFYQSGKTMLSRGEIEAAERDFTEAIAMDPSMADAYYHRAEAYLQSEKTILAEADYIRAGEIYRTQKRYATALDAFTKAIDINEESVAALLNRGDIYVIQENRGAALDDYQDAAKYDKDNFRANFELGKLYFSFGQHKDADKRLREAKDIDPSVPEVYHYMMLNYFARDDFNKVKKTYSDFKERIPEDDVQSFKINPRFDAIIRVVGEYERP